MKKIRVGLIGFGTVGSGVVEVIRARRAYLRERSGVDIELVKVCDKDLKSKRPVKVEKRLLTKDFGKVIYDPHIDVVVELIGGIRPAKDIIVEAIRQGKHIVTANKALLSEAGSEIFALADACGVAVGFEASVGGGIPIIRALKEGLVANRVDLVYGIINGTSNFILTKMEDEDLSFSEALERARAMGYAERNPILDTSGMDSAHKLAIVAYLGFGFAARPADIYTEGIHGMDLADIHYARELGYAVRLLAIAKRSGRNLELRVHPTLLPKQHLLAHVKGVYNALFVKGDLVGEVLFYGEGAGKYPTASSVVSDIVDIGKNCAKVSEIDMRAGTKKGLARIEPIDRIKVRHFIRFSAIDKPGVLKSISGILAKRKISISSVTQKEKRSQKVVPIIMMTHEAEERAMREALAEIDRLAVIKKKSVRIRIEG